MYEMLFPRVLRLESDSPPDSRDMSSGLRGDREGFDVYVICSVPKLRFSDSARWEGFHNVVCVASGNGPIGISFLPLEPF